MTERPITDYAANAEGLALLAFDDWSEARDAIMHRIDNRQTVAYSPYLAGLLRGRAQNSARLVRCAIGRGPETLKDRAELCDLLRVPNA